MMKKISYTIMLLVLAFTTASWAHDSSGGVTVDVLAKTTTSWNGAALPGYNPGTPEVTILRIVIPAKTKLPLHQHLVINAGVLIKGELTVVTQDKKTLHLNAGDPIVEVVDTWHYGRNDGEGPAEIIVFYAGIKGVPITVKAPVAK
ncbi:Cupin domain protein [Desulfocicer vacuolatum DSM 3385]|uniref:Cupin domain protein n=1 Tax=Desulfocicer vacuolatum DSM 3385 TaxID=1121400 RepID=A0A1W2EET7_9BACT|nr:cupin domain-containing protein [Desulfocicer vacuolatum]SMD07608.1 Cupin domain protein [Desulfocicer vacuolatum DSM 3385]